MNFCWRCVILGGCSVRDHGDVQGTYEQDQAMLYDVELDSFLPRTVVTPENLCEQIALLENCGISGGGGGTVDTNTTYNIQIINGVEYLVGSDGTLSALSSHTVDTDTDTDTNTTYTIQTINGELFLVGSDGSQSLIGNIGGIDTNTTYTIQTINGDAYLVGDDGSQVAIPDNVIPDTNTTYTIQLINGQQYLVGSDGSQELITATDTDTDLTRIFRNFWCYNDNGVIRKGTTHIIRDEVGSTEIPEYRDENGDIVNIADFTVVACTQETGNRFVLDEVECFEETGTGGTGTETVTFSTNLACHLNKILTDVVTAYSGKRMNIGEFCFSQTNDVDYYGGVQSEILDRIKSYNDCDNEDISTTIWASSTDYGAGYPCMMYQADGNGNSGITYSGPQAGIWETHYLDNPYNGTNWSGFDFDFGADPNGVTNTNPYPNGFGAIADNMLTVATAEDMIDRGVQTVRLPIRWERLEPNISDGTTVIFEPQYEALIQQVYDNVAQANANTGGNLTVWIDIHNYAAYQRANGAILINNIQAEYNAMLVAVVNRWGNHSVWQGIDIMNEPKNLANSGVWQTVSQSAYNALRLSGYTGDIIINTYPWGGIQDVLANHPTPWIAETNGNDQNLIYSFHWYPDPNNNNIGVGQPGNTPWDQFESEAVSEANSTCDANYNSYETCIEQAECKKYRRYILADEDNNPVLPITYQYRDYDTRVVTDVTGKSTCECAC